MKRQWVYAKRNDKNLLIECACGCGAIRHMLDHKRRIHIYINGHNATGKPSGNWKGGRTKKNEYWYIYNPGHHFHDLMGYVLEHRWNYEQHYKCTLLPWAACHHIDANTENNDVSNLQALMHRDHSKLENKRGIRSIVFAKGNPYGGRPKGGIPWNKGKPWSEEIKKKISKAKKASV